MILNEAVWKLIHAPVGSYLKNRALMEGGVFYQMSDEPLIYKRYPENGVMSWPWKPTANMLFSNGWELEVRHA